MDHQYIAENNLIERYVLGRLPVEEQIRFEEHFAECSECLAELELADDLGQALRAAAAEDARRIVETSVKTGLFATLERWLRGPRAAILLGSLLALIVLPTLWLATENQRLAEDLARLNQPQVDVPAITLNLRRDFGPAVTAPTLDLPTDAAWLSLAIETGDEDPRISGFDVTLEDTTASAEARVLWRGENLAPPAWGLLSLTFPTTLVPVGSYRLIVTARDDEGREEPIGRFPFRVLAAASNVEERTTP